VSIWIILGDTRGCDTCLHSDYGIALLICRIYLAVTVTLCGVHVAPVSAIQSIYAVFW